MRRAKNDNSDKSKTLRKISIIAISVFIISVVALGIYIFSLLSRMKYNPEKDGPGAFPEETLEPTWTGSLETPMPSPEPTPDLTPKSNEEYGVINIIVFGVDNRYKNSYQGRSDVNIILTLDTVNNEIRIASILRDTLIYLPAQQDYNRINAAIVYEEGPEGAVAAIESAFNIDIDHFMITSFRKVARIIETVGGVTVKLSQEEAWSLNGNLQEMNLLYGYNRQKDMIYSTGNVNLNGLQAVAYMRIREIDSDIARSDRQMEVMTNLKEKLMNSDLDTFNTLLAVVTDNVKTDMGPAELLDVAMVMYNLRAGSIKTTHAPFEGYYEQTTYNGMSIFKIDTEKTSELLRRFVYEGVEP